MMLFIIPKDARTFNDKTTLQTDSYLQNFEAQVVQLDQESNAIALNQTAFYPGGGGQPADGGAQISRSGLQVTRAKKKLVIWFFTF